jgi:hypothetical protein
MMRVLPGASLLYVVLRVLQTVNQPPYSCLNSLRSGEKIGRIHGGSTACIQTLYSLVLALLARPHF